MMEECVGGIYLSVPVDEVLLSHIHMLEANVVMGMVGRFIKSQNWTAGLE